MMHQAVNSRTFYQLQVLRRSWLGNGRDHHRASQVHSLSTPDCSLMDLNLINKVVSPVAAVPFTPFTMLVPRPISPSTKIQSTKLDHYSLMKFWNTFGSRYFIRFLILIRKLLFVKQLTQLLEWTVYQCSFNNADSLKYGF